MATSTAAAAASPAASTSGAIQSSFARTPPFTNDKAHLNKGIDFSTRLKVYRGYLQEYWRNGTAPGVSLGGGTIPVSQQYRLYFYYNPNDIAVAWAIAQGIQYDPEYIAPGAGPQSNPAYGTTISWDMLFDRVGEGNFVPEGVLQDVRVFDKIITNGQIGSNGYESTVASQPFVRVQFSRNGGGMQPPLGYTGFITAASIDYTQFDIDMVPTRCVIQVTMQALVFQPEITPLDDPTQGAGGTAGYTTPKWALGTKLNAYDGFGLTTYQPGPGNRKARDFDAIGTTLGQLNNRSPTGPVNLSTPPNTRPSNNGSGSVNRV